ncbi:MAG: hypothetical protein IAF08_04440 [Rhizobacter sp.]|nr:hypothetical protein [Chlorobiales bacterium]
MILILDKNILFYASYYEQLSGEQEKKQPVCRQLIDELRRPSCMYQVAYSQEILREYYRVGKPKPSANPVGESPRAYLNKFIKEIESRVYPATPDELPEELLAYLEQVKFDRDDYKYVQLAVSEKIKLIITEDSGDFSLIKDYLSRNYGVEVLTAAEALEKLF